MQQFMVLTSGGFAQAHRYRLIQAMVASQSSQRLTL